MLQVNLVATQLTLDREHPNCLEFVPEHGLDPNINMALRGANLRALIQGRASSWQDHLILTPLAGSGGALSSCLTLCGDVSSILQMIAGDNLPVPTSLQVKVWNI